MKILGNRVYLNLPDIQESKFSISPELKKELKEKEIEKFDRLTVYAVGKGAIGSSALTEEISIKEGDEVYVDPMGMKRGVILKIDGKDKVSVSLFDIMHIW